MRTHTHTHTPHTHTHTLTCVHTHIPHTLSQFLIAGVITYSLFEVLYKRLATKKDDPASVPNGVRFLGYVGVHTLLWLWPPIIILHFAKVEVFEWPNWEILGMMTLNGLFDVIFNSCILVSIVLSSPLFTRLTIVTVNPVIPRITLSFPG